MDLHGDALKRIMGDMDDMEGKKMFPSTGGGATITISVQPGAPDMEGGEGPEETETPDMNKGGLAYSKGGMVDESSTTAEKLPADKMAAGGMAMPEPPEDLGLPPFLRKKKGFGAK